MENQARTVDGILNVPPSFELLVEVVHPASVASLSSATCLLLSRNWTARTMVISTVSDVKCKTNTPQVTTHSVATASRALNLPQLSARCQAILGGDQPGIWLPSNLRVTDSARSFLQPGVDSHGIPLIDLGVDSAFESATQTHNVHHGVRPILLAREDCFKIGQPDSDWIEPAGTGITLYRV